MTIPGKTRNTQKRKRQGRPVKTNPTDQELREREKFTRRRREAYLLSTGEPRWVIVEWHNRCDTCGVTLHRGEQAYYVPETGKMYGSVCRCAYDVADSTEISARRWRSENSE